MKKSTYNYGAVYIKTIVVSSSYARTIQLTPILLMLINDAEKESDV